MKTRCEQHTIYVAVFSVLCLAAITNGELTDKSETELRTLSKRDTNDLELIPELSDGSSDGNNLDELAKRFNEFMYGDDADKRMQEITDDIDTNNLDTDDLPYFVLEENEDKDGERYDDKSENLEDVENGEDLGVDGYSYIAPPGKRFRAPMGFTGLLGKRMSLDYVDGLHQFIDASGKRAPMGFRGQLGKRTPMGFRGQLGKRAPMGFRGQLGKRAPMGFRGQLGKRTPMGFRGQLGKRTPMGFRGQLGKRTPMGFRGQLGKRTPMGFIGQLGKRAPMGFRGQLGKRAPMGFRGQLGKRAPMGFIGQLGKRAPMGFLGQLGKRYSTYVFAQPERRAPMGFIGQLGKRGGPMGFLGQLGKRGT